MTLNRDVLIQVNATIIAGLLILLSFQSLSSPIYETQVVNSLNRMDEDGMQFNEINNLYNEHCLNPMNNTFTFLNSSDVKNLCKKWEIQKDETHQHGLVLYQNLEMWGVLKNNAVTPNAWTVIWSPLYAKMAVGLILIPFVSSILFEVVRKTPTNIDTSVFSVASFVIGLVLLLIGLGIFIIVANSTPPWTNLNYTRS